MAACPKISRGGIFEKFSARGGYTKNTPPTPLFPLPDISNILNCLHNLLYF